MTDLAIYGAGGFGRETALMIEQINAACPKWKLLGYFDDGLEKGAEVNGLPVLGGIAEVNTYAQPLSLVVAVADPGQRRKLVETIQNGNLSFPVLAHPSASLGSVTNFFGEGCIITAGCILTTDIVLGDFSIVNLTSTIGHDVKVGSFCSIMPGCNISGNVQIGEATMMGTGARILQNLTIGKSCRIGAGAVVTKTFGDGLTLIGVPAVAIKDR